MNDMLTLGQMLTVHARVLGEASGARDLERSMTFRQWNERSCRLANALLGLGLAKGDRVAVLAYNCVEWLEIYAATAKAGLVAVPINFRLIGAGDRATSSSNAEARALIVQDELVGVVEEIRGDLPITAGNATSISAQAPCPAGYRAYEDLIAAGSDREPAQQVAAGRPVDADVHLGHHGQAQGRDAQPSRRARCCRWSPRSSLACTATTARLLVMPMCHANSLNFFGAFAYCGGATSIYSRKSFDPEHAARRWPRAARPSPRWCRPTTS